LLRSRPLVISSDAALVDAISAVAAEANVQLDVVADVGLAQGVLGSASLVLIDAALVGHATMPWRRSIVIVSRRIEEPQMWRRLTAAGAERVIELPDGAPWLFERFGRSLDEPTAGELVVVVGAAGGAGTSTLAAALTRYVADDGRRSVLVDLDPQGGGIDLLVGAEDQVGARWDELAGISGRVDERVLVPALPVISKLPVLSWQADSEIEPDPNAVGHVLDALLRQPGVVVVDAGRATDPRAQLALTRSSRVVLLVPLRVRAVSAARAHIRSLAGTTPAIVVRQPSPGGLNAGDASAALGLDVAAVLADDRRRAEVEELGGPIPSSSAWRRVCEAVLSLEHRVAA
jgi:secretion/DNA translocation related CpaE-like protein